MEKKKIIGIVIGVAFLLVGLFMGLKDAGLF